MEFAAVMPGDKQGSEAVQKSQAAKQLDNMAKKTMRQEEDLNKKKLLEREKENFKNIFALKCYNGWLKLHDNSALIVSTWLDGRLGRTYNRNDDGGYGVRAQYGVVSIPPDSVTDFVQRLARAQIKLTYDAEWVLEFELGERVSREEMVRMLHEDELVIDKVNKLVMPKEVLPGLRAATKSLLDNVHAIVRHQRESIKDIFLNDVERLAIDLNKLVIATSRGVVEIEECLEKVGGFTEELYEDATTMVDMKLLSAKQYKEMVDLIKGVEGEQARVIKRRALEKADKDIAKTRKKTDDKSKSTVSGRG